MQRQSPTDTYPVNRYLANQHLVKKDIFNRHLLCRYIFNDTLSRHAIDGLSCTFPCAESTHLLAYPACLDVLILCTVHIVIHVYKRYFNEAHYANLDRHD